MSKKRIAVIGAGIAGLTCAYNLQEKGFEVTVFEKEPTVGGRMSSRTKDGFVFDLGADHLCDLYDHMKAYDAKFGIKWEKMRFLKYGVMKHGVLTPFSKVVSKLTQMRLAFLYFRARKGSNDFFNMSTVADKDFDNAYDYMTRWAGKDAADYLADPYATTYQFHRAKEASVAAMFSAMRSIDKEPERWYLQRTEGGMQALPDAFASRLTVRTATPVTAMSAEENGVRITTGTGEETFDAAVLAAEAPHALKLYKNPTEAQRTMLAASEYAASISVAFRVDRAKLPEHAVIWVPFVESQKISGIVNEAMKGEELVHDGKTLLCTWLHEGFAESLMNLSDEEIFTRVKEEFVRVCPWVSDASEVMNHDLQRWPLAMPKFAHGHLTRVAEFLAKHQGEQRVYLCGDYLNSPWTEGALRCGERVAEQVAKEMV